MGNATACDFCGYVSRGSYHGMSFCYTCDGKFCPNHIENHKCTNCTTKKS